MTNRINLISGPRNISTALMYSFANRDDTTVIDEPMYAFYLKNYKIDHPGKEEIMKSLPAEINEVLDQLIFGKVSTPIYFIKGMAHHYLDLSLDFILKLNNVFLIRDPHKLILSFSKVIPYPTLNDIGIKKEYEIFQFLENQGHDPIIIDADRFLMSPERMLHLICERLNVPFSIKMLKWPAGPIKEDGTWAKYWYSSVHQSTGFISKKKRVEELPSRLSPLYHVAMKYYNILLEKSITT